MCRGYSQVKDLERLLQPLLIPPEAKGQKEQCQGREGDVEWLLAWDAEGSIEQGMQLFFTFKEIYLSEIYADQWGFHLCEIRPR